MQEIFIEISPENDRDYRVIITPEIGREIFKATLINNRKCDNFCVIS
jgi:hypothetical protein